MSDFSNTPNPGTKIDRGSSLAGNQKVSNPCEPTPHFEYIPYSPPHSELNCNEFHEGFSWTEAPGKVHASAGDGSV